MAHEVLQDHSTLKEKGMMEDRIRRNMIAQSFIEAYHLRDFPESIHVIPMVGHRFAHACEFGHRDARAGQWKLVCTQKFVLPVENGTSPLFGRMLCG